MEENCVCVNVYCSIMYRYLRTKGDDDVRVCVCVCVYVSIFIYIQSIILCIHLIVCVCIGSSAVLYTAPVSSVYSGRYIFNHQYSWL